MSRALSRFSLRTDAYPAGSHDPGGRWQFVLDHVSRGTRFEASDFEFEFSLERLHLLAVVRGLEAIDEPGRITLITPSTYVGRGLAESLDQWRESDWQWEWYGEMTPVKHADLWKRIDRARQIHTIETRVWRLNRDVLDSRRKSPVVRRPIVGTANWAAPFADFRNRFVPAPTGSLAGQFGM